MAISYLGVSFQSRSKGHKAVAGAAYRAGVALYDERYAMGHNYEGRGDVQHSEIVLPKGADERFSDREYLWNQVEFAENRKDSQVAIDYVLALPREIDLSNQIALAREFAQYHFVDHGLVVDMAIHDKGDGNPHAHLYTTTRRLLGSQFDRLKARDMMPTVKNGFVVPEQEHLWNEKYREFQEKYFKAQGLAVSVDPNHLVSMRHEGRAGSPGEGHYLKEDNADRLARCVEIALHDPEALLNTLASRQAVFNEKDLAKAIHKYTDSAEEFQVAFARALAHPDCVALGIGADGRETYTTRQNTLREANMADQATTLFARDDHAVDGRFVRQAIAARSLSSEQKEALSHVTKAQDISVLVGRAGTGKSYLMDAAREVWEAQGYRVSGVAVSGIAAKNLRDETGMPTLTIHGFKQKLLQQETLALSENDVLVVDEAGMVSTQDMAALVGACHEVGAKLVLVGDPDQLQPVSAGAPFRALASRVGFVSMDNIRRQRDAGDRQASVQLSQGEVSLALDHYAAKGAIHFIEDKAVSNKEISSDRGNVAQQRSPAIDEALVIDQLSAAKFGGSSTQGVQGRSASYQRVVDDWFDSHNQHLDLKHLEKAGSQLMLAHRNADVAALNRLARERLIAAKQLSAEGVTVSVTRTEGKEKAVLTLAPGDRLVFLRNNAKMGVKNGQFASVLSIKGDQLTVQLDGQGKKAKPFTFSISDYADIDYGYAATVHKTQGVTLDKAFVYAGGQGWNRHLAYVALSRHRDAVQLYASSLDHKDLSDLASKLSREEYRDNVLDFPLSYATHRGFDAEKTANGFVAKVMGAASRIKDTWLFVSNYEAFVKRQMDKRDAKHFASLKPSRELAKASASYIDMMRSLQQDRYALSQALSGKAFFEDARYGKLVERQRALDGIAAQLWQHRDQLEEVFARNRYSLEKLEKAAVSHQRFTLVEQYLHGFVSGEHARCLKAAPKIQDNFKAHFTALSHLAGQQGLDLKVVCQQLRHDARQVERLTLLANSSTEEKQALYAVERYFALQDSSKAIWRSVYARGDNPSTREQSRLTALSIQQDKVASQIVANISVHLPALSLYGIDTDKLIDKTVSHTRREAVKRLEQLTFLVDRREHAHALLQERENYRYIYERKANWKELAQLSLSYEQAQFVKNLSPKERKAYELVARYNQARVDTAKCWSQYFDLQAKGRDELAYVLKHAKNFTQKRDGLAYQLVLHQAVVAPFVEKIKAPVSDIKKQAKRHLDVIAKAQGKTVSPKSASTSMPVASVTSAYPAVTEKTIERLDADTVNQALVAMGEDFYRVVLGEDGRRSGNQMRFGDKDHFSVTLAGSHAGAWYSFETDEGGYPLQLLMNNTHGWGLSFKEALEEGARLAGVSPDKIIIPEKVLKQQAEKAQAKQSALTKTEDEKIQARIAAARYYWRSAQPIAGTLGEKYLREFRHISGDLSSFRYHPRIKDPETKQYYPGIVVAAANEHRELRATQTILLGPDGNKAKAENGLNVIKRSRGVVKGAAVLIHKGKTEGQQQVVIAEGPETAASLITALPDAHIYVTLGNISNAKELHWLSEKHGTKQFYFAADNDGINGQAIKKIQDVAATLKYQHDIDCFIAKPSLPGKALDAKIDFNDVLIAQDEAGVKKQVEHFDKIFVPEKPTLIDEKTIDESFMPAQEEWDKLEDAFNPDFQALSTSYAVLSFPDTPGHMKASSQKSFDRTLEKIYLSEESMKELHQLSPNIYQIVKAQGDSTLGLKNNWLDSIYQNEWKALEQEKNPLIITMVENKKLLSDSRDSKNKKIYAQFLEGSIARAFTDKSSFSKLKELAPKITQQAKIILAKKINKDKGKSR